MAKIRSVSPSACISPDLAAVSDRAALMFLLLPCHCDDYGVMPYHPAKLKALVFPMRDVTADECALLVDELSAHDMVSVYEAEGASWLHVTNFSKYQHPARMRRSDWPLPPWLAAQCPDSAATAQGQCPDSAEAVREQCAGSAEAVQGQCGSSAEGAECGENFASPDNRQCPDSAATVQGQCPDSAEAVPRQCREAAGEGEGEGENHRAIAHPADFDDPAEQIVRDVAAQAVAHLNRRCRRKFKDDSPATLRLVRARMREGHTAADFIAVVDNKAHWMTDPKMRRYLRPETLWCAKHFESYLNEGGGADDAAGEYSGAF
ncbi:conserved phage C-terminal domain-containing protein [uncultured Adlercreutzia sp.]|uniref:conserved phage C-terminal domain-containing protein n=1 Tax=uncultured Adlercreutzia sp. TaxID=875803 RepID=UPI00266C6721|nr:conserved phage C-terminal domain-containing protein [uncultured Adlercreutzia sp.]